jgi:hypothetical protein
MRLGLRTSLNQLQQNSQIFNNIIHRSIIQIFIQIVQKIWELWIEIEAAIKSMAFIALILTKLSFIRFLLKHFVTNRIKFKDKHKVS